MTSWDLHHLFLSFVALLSELLGTISGFGSSTFFVPIGTLFESFRLVLVLTAFLHTISNLSKIYLFRGAFNGEAYWKLALTSILLTGLGAYFSSFVSQEVARPFLAILLLFLAPLLLWQRRFQKFLSIKIVFIVVGISGFLTGLIGTGGALRGFALASAGFGKETFVLLSAIIDLGGDIFRLLVYLNKGYMDWSQWAYIPLLLLAAFLGARLGQFVLKKIPQENFEKVVAAMIFVSGLILLFDG